MFIQFKCAGISHTLDYTEEDVREELKLLSDVDELEDELEDYFEADYNN